MKKIKLIHFLFFHFLLSFSSITFSQAPEKMSYQSVIRNSSNSLVVNQSVRLRISILQGIITGSAVYSEQHQTTTNSNGLVTISIGSGTSPTGSFSAINWANGPYFVKMEADPTGGTNYTVSGTSQLLSVPYALYAKNSGNGIERFSTIGDTLFLENGSHMIFPGLSLANISSAPGPSVLYDGYSYPTIKLGNGQEWFAENLKNTHFSDGSNIPIVSDPSIWASNFNTSGHLPMMSWFNNDQITYSNNKCGALYNWHSIDVSSNGNKNICPTGWHIPSVNDWNYLTNYLGTGAVAAAKLKSITGWSSVNGNNQSGFTSLECGIRGVSGEFLNFENAMVIGSFYWSNAQINSDIAWSLLIQDHVTQFNENKNAGFAIRCLKDD
jgi:uncharacterized protein (TIGR02145 family)